MIGIKYNAVKNQHLFEDSTGYYLHAYTRNNVTANSLWGNIVGLSENSSNATYIGTNFKTKAEAWLTQW